MFTQPHFQLINYLNSLSILYAKASNSTLAEHCFRDNFHKNIRIYQPCEIEKMLKINTSSTEATINEVDDTSFATIALLDFFLNNVSLQNICTTLNYIPDMTTAPEIVELEKFKLPQKTDKENLATLSHFFSTSSRAHTDALFTMCIELYTFLVNVNQQDLASDKILQLFSQIPIRSCVNQKSAHNLKGHHGHFGCKIFYKSLLNQARARYMVEKDLTLLTNRLEVAKSFFEVFNSTKLIKDSKAKNWLGVSASFVIDATKDLSAVQQVDATNTSNDEYVLKFEYKKAINNHHQSIEQILTDNAIVVSYDEENLLYHLFSINDFAPLFFNDYKNDFKNKLECLSLLQKSTSEYINKSHLYNQLNSAYLNWAIKLADIVASKSIKYPRPNTAVIPNSSLKINNHIKLQESLDNEVVEFGDMKECLKYCFDILSHQSSNRNKRYKNSITLCTSILKQYAYLMSSNKATYNFTAKELLCCLHDCAGSLNVLKKSLLELSSLLSSQASRSTPSVTDPNYPKTVVRRVRRVGEISHQKYEAIINLWLVEVNLMDKNSTSVTNKGELKSKTHKI